MIEFVIGFTIGAFVMWTRNKALRAAYRDLLLTAQKQVAEYYKFRNEFDSYRARFDPVDLKQTGNVVTIVRKKNDL